MGARIKFLLAAMLGIALPARADRADPVECCAPADPVPALLRSPDMIAGRGRRYGGSAHDRRKARRADERAALLTK